MNPLTKIWSAHCLMVNNITIIITNCQISSKLLFAACDNPFNGLFFQDNLGKQAPERLNQSFRTLMKTEMMWWQWHHLDHMQMICTSLQTDNHASTPTLNLLQARCSSWCPTKCQSTEGSLYLHNFQSLCWEQYRAGDARPLTYSCSHGAMAASLTNYRPRNSFGWLLGCNGTSNTN